MTTNAGNDATRSVSELQPEADGAVLFNLYMYAATSEVSLLCVLLSFVAGCCHLHII